ncbi:class I SAM-dependent methyltransferase, partial [Frankia sp. CpI1-P]
MSKATLVSRHYETFSEGPRLRASRLRRLEFQTTVRTLHRWLPPTATVLELGAGHGAYSFLLDRMGHRVTATDLLADNVRAMAEKAERHGRPSIRVEQVDASSLAGFPTASYQAVLCLGPYYHLRTWERRRNCLEECRRVADA